MPARPQALDNYVEAIGRLADRLRGVEEVQRSRVLPPGYEFTTAGGALQIRRIADGATTTLEFP